MQQFLSFSSTKSLNQFYLNSALTSSILISIDWEILIFYVEIFIGKNGNTYESVIKIYKTQYSNVLVSFRDQSFQQGLMKCDVLLPTIKYAFWVSYTNSIVLKTFSSLWIFLMLNMENNSVNTVTWISTLLDLKQDCKQHFLILTLQLHDLY